MCTQNKNATKEKNPVLRTMLIMERWAALRLSQNAEGRSVPRAETAGNKDLNGS